MSEGNGAPVEADAQKPVEVDAQKVEQSLIGTVVNSPMDKTAVVAIEKTAVHRLYRRRYKRTSKLYAHDPANETREGDRVLVVASRPISKTKRWRVKEILQRAEEA